MSPNSVRLRQPLRFVHASDLHLDRTLEGVLEHSGSWESRFLDISRRAAERLFLKAIEEEVDFVLLCGDVLNANLAPPGLFLFLVEQFELLRKSGISVYWAGGEFDSPEDWPIGFQLPDNVHHFPSNSIQEFYFQRSTDSELGGTNSAVAKIVGMSRNQHRRTIRATEFPIDPGEIFTIAVANGDIDAESLGQRRIDYWGLGGSRERFIFHGNPRKKGIDGKSLPLDSQDAPSGIKRDFKTLPPPPYSVHYPGATVARSPQDIGSFGATLVEIPWGEEPILTFFPTSPIRWTNDQISVDVSADGGVLADEIRTRLKNYREIQKTDDLMISWYVDVPPGPLAATLRRGKYVNDLLNELRTMYGHEEPMIWSVGINYLLPNRLPAPYYEQQTIFGDFLRGIKQHQDTPHEIIEVDPYLPKEWGADDDLAPLRLATKIMLESSEHESANAEPINEQKKRYRFEQTKSQQEMQQKILREAAMIGLELLGEPRIDGK
ncbi:MAG: metallophosphoesterase family protein [Thermoguttaceae bacterium]